MKKKFFCLRPDNLLTNFVTWRGLLTKLLCSPYSKTEPWRLAATLYNGTIYLSEIETEEAKRNRETQTPRMKEMCYWGVKFEDYVTSTGSVISMYLKKIFVGLQFWKACHFVAGLRTPLISA